MTQGKRGSGTPCKLKRWKLALAIATTSTNQEHPLSYCREGLYEAAAQSFPTSNACPPISDLSSPDIKSLELQVAGGVDLRTTTKCSPMEAYRYTVRSSSTMSAMFGARRLPLNPSGWMNTPISAPMLHIALLHTTSPRTPPQQREIDCTVAPGTSKCSGG